MTVMAPQAVGESLDPRDPLLRLATFFDDGSVELLHERDRSGVLAAAGTVNGVRTIAFCTDGTVMGGAMGVEGCAHIVNAYDTAIEEQSPIVGLWHSGGARLAEGVKALHAVGLVFEAMIRASGYVPQISVVVGFAAGGAAYGPALTDVVVMAPEGRVFVTGPDIVRSVTGEDVDMASLGARTRITRSRVCATSSPTTSSTPTSAAAGWSDCSASRAISTATRPRRVTRTCTRCCRIRRDAPTTCTRCWMRCSTATPRSRNSRPSGHRRWSSVLAGCPGGLSACLPTTRCGWAAA